MILNELQDQEHITLTAALKSLIHPFAFSFKYPQITGLPHGLGGDLLLLVCIEPGVRGFLYTSDSCSALRNDRKKETGRRDTFSSFGRG